VWPHCGPSNTRIRAHLGLVVPEGCCRMRVANETIEWKEGKIIVFDDSFEHEVKFLRFYALIIKSAEKEDINN